MFPKEVNFKELWYFMATEYIGIGTITKAGNVSDYIMFPMNPWMEIQVNFFLKSWGIMMFP